MLEIEIKQNVDLNLCSVGKEKKGKNPDKLSPAAEKRKKAAKAREKKEKKLEQERLEKKGWRRKRWKKNLDRKKKSRKKTTGKDDETQTTTKVQSRLCEGTHKKLFQVKEKPTSFRATN